MRLGIIFALLGVGIFATAQEGCARRGSSTKVRFILPSGFNGAIKVVEDQAGVAPVIKNGVCDFAIPSAGVLAVTDESVFTNWHSLYAVLPDGTVLPNENEATASQTSIYELGTISINGGKEADYYFVGTKAEADAYKQKIEH